MAYKITLAALLALTLTACTTTNFQAYEGANNERIGQGGTKKTVDGIDIWDNGDPPRKYQIIGFIDDERDSGGFHKLMRDGAIAKKVKESGGDAAIIASSQSQLAGMISSGNAYGYSAGRQTTAFGTGFSTPISRSYSKYVVIKYLP